MSVVFVVGGSRLHRVPEVNSLVFLTGILRETMNGAYAMARLRWLFVLVITVSGLGFYTTSSQAAYIVTAFAGSVYSPNTAAMDAALGISGYTIEDFEDTVLISGLTISFNGLIPQDKSYTILPKTFDSASDSQTANNYWDGTKVLTNAGNGLNGPFLPTASTNTTFTLATGAPVVGIGLANFQSALSSPTNPFPVTDHTLFVNGQSLGTVEALAGGNWSGGVAVRNAYLRIEGTGGSLITSIRFQNDTAQDFLVFDRLAVFAVQNQAVPEPASLLIFGAGGLCLSIARNSSYRRR